MNTISRKNLYISIIGGLCLGTAIILLIYFFYIKPNSSQTSK